MGLILYKGRFLGILLIILSLTYIVVGFVIPPKRNFPPLSSLEAKLEISTAQLMGEGFAENAVHPFTDRSSAPVNIKYFGSWLGSNKYIGKTHSPWYQTTGSFCLMVAGYPCFGKNSLGIHLKDGKEKLTPIRLKGVNPGEKWIMIKMITGNKGEPHKIRIIATDGEIGAHGWIGVSQPFDDKLTLRSSLLALLRIVLTIAASIVLIIGPGLAFRANIKSPNSLWRSFSLIAFPGIILQTFIGLIVWLLAPVFNPQFISVLLILPVLLWCLVMAIRRSINEILSPTEYKVLVIFIAVVIVAVAKGIYSQGPAGELYGGTISRTLEVGGHSDSRISFHTVQLVANGIKPYSNLGSSYFAPWSFSHRGPIAGLAVSPLVILSGANVPKDMPDQPWLPFDPEGFAAYRICMSVMAATSLLVLFGLLSLLLNSQAGLFAIAIASTSPFVFHEVYFTWPKLQATAFVLMGFYLLFVKRSGWAGIMFGIGYLLHPIALFYSPIIWVLWLILSLRKNQQKNHLDMLHSSLSKHRKQWRIFRINSYAILTFGLVVLLWYAINYGHFRQTDFLNYFKMVDGHHAISVFEWLRGRAQSVANTIIPFNLYFFYGHHPSMNSVFGKSPDIIVFFLQYWNTVPFGLGLSCLALLLVQLYRGAKKFPLEFLATIVVPFFAFSIYWGGAITGMMREGLHVWVFGVLIFTTWSWVSGSKGKARLAKWQSALISLRVVEIALMLLLPSLISRKTIIKEQYFIIDVMMLATMILGIGWLGKMAYVISRTPICLNMNRRSCNRT